MSRYSRREFMKAGVAAGALMAATGTVAAAEVQTATDSVELGRSGVKVTRLGVWDREHEWQGAARPGAGGVYAAGAVCV